MSSNKFKSRFKEKFFIDRTKQVKSVKRLVWPPLAYLCLIILILVLFASLDLSLHKGNVFSDWSKKHKNQNSIKDILTVDSIVTGSMFTFIVVSIDRGGDMITRTKNKIYWSSAKLYVVNDSNFRFSFIKYFVNFGRFMQLSPITSVLLSITCTICEGVSMYLGTTIFAIVCLLITTILMISSVFRVNYFSKNWIYTFAYCVSENKYGFQNHLQNDIDQFIKHVKDAKKDKLSKNEFSWMYENISKICEEIIGWDLFSEPTETGDLSEETVSSENVVNRNVASTSDKNIGGNNG